VGQGEDRGLLDRSWQNQEQNPTLKAVTEKKTGGEGTQQGETTNKRDSIERKIGTGPVKTSTEMPVPADRYHLKDWETKKRHDAKRVWTGLALTQAKNEETETVNVPGAQSLCLRMSTGGGSTENGKNEITLAPTNLPTMKVRGESTQGEKAEHEAVTSST